MNYLGYLVLIAAIGVVFLVVWSIYYTKPKVMEPKYKRLDTVFYGSAGGYQVGYIQDVFRVEDINCGDVHFGYNLEGTGEGFEESDLYPSYTAMKAAFDARFDEEHPDYAPRDMEANRSAKSGRYVSDEEAKANPDTTVTEKFRREYPR